MKFLIIFNVSVLLLCVLSISAQSHNFKWGTMDKLDRLFHRDIVVKKASTLQRVTADFVYIAYGRITCINATDQYVNGKGGNVTITNGGIGANNVTLHLTSQRNHGFNFIIEIFGK